MQDEQPPVPRFRRFEKVIVTDRNGHRHTGTVLWRDLVRYHPFCPSDTAEVPQRWSQWEYAIDLPDFGSCPTFEEDRLESTGAFDPEEAHRGRRHEISFDTGLEDDNPIVEGTYRIPGEFWQVFLFEKADGRGEAVAVIRHEFRTWPSGITGIAFLVPEEDVVDKAYILRAFANVFGVDEWVEVRGPDSLLMK